MIYRHQKFAHTQEVGEWETVRRRVLERAGWKADAPSTGNTTPAPDDQPAAAPKPRRAQGRQMTTKFAGPFARAFCKVWAMHDEPELAIVEPVANWELDAGVTYDPHQDQFVDEDGQPVAVDWAGQPAESVPFIPAPQTNAVALSIFGVVTTTASDRNIVLRWSADTQERIASAWGVAIGEKLYRVREWVLVPEVNPHEIRVSLTEA